MIILFKFIISCFYGGRFYCLGCSVFGSSKPLQELLHAVIVKANNNITENDDSFFILLLY